MIRSINDCYDSMIQQIQLKRYKSIDKIQSIVEKQKSQLVKIYDEQHRTQCQNLQEVSIDSIIQLLDGLADIQNFRSFKDRFIAEKNNIIRYGCLEENHVRNENLIKPFKRGVQQIMKIANQKIHARRIAQDFDKTQQQIKRNLCMLMSKKQKIMIVRLKSQNGLRVNIDEDTDCLDEKLNTISRYQKQDIDYHIVIEQIHSNDYWNQIVDKINLLNVFELHIVCYSNQQNKEHDIDFNSSQFCEAIKSMKNLTKLTIWNYEQSRPGTQFKKSVSCLEYLEVLTLGQY